MVKLTSMVKASGCAAKLDPQKLHDALSRLPEMRNDRLLEGFESVMMHWSIRWRGYRGDRNGGFLPSDGR